jgi:hypothetical protein
MMKLERMAPYTWMFSILAAFFNTVSSEAWLELIVVTAWMAVSWFPDIHDEENHPSYLDDA